MSSPIEKTNATRKAGQDWVFLETGCRLWFPAARTDLGVTTRTRDPSATDIPCLPAWRALSGNSGLIAFFEPGARILIFECMGKGVKSGKGELPLKRGLRPPAYRTNRARGMGTLPA